MGITPGYTYPRWELDSSGNPIGMTGPDGEVWGAAYAKDTSGNVTGLVGPDGETISTFGENVLTVGSGGRFATIQAAIDYVETQSAFTAITMNANGSVASWAQNASTFAPDTVPTTAVSKFVTPVDTEWVWFKVADDTYHYPLEEIKGVSAGVAALMGITSGMRRIEASVATTKALTWYRQNDFVIYLIDQSYTENVTISANVNIVFAGTGRNTWNGNIGKGASFVSGSLTFKDITVGAAGDNGMFNWLADNTIKLHFVDCEIASVHDDFIFPSSYIGSIFVERCTVKQQPTAEQGHCIAPGYVRGDVIVQDVVWRASSHASTFVTIDNVFLVDIDNTARNVIINGVSGFIRDKQAQFAQVAIFGSKARKQTVAGEVLINNCHIACPDTLAASSVVSMVLFCGASTGCDVHIGNCSFNVPNTSGSVKLVHAVAALGGACTAKIGRGNSTVACTAQTNLTYTMVAAGVAGTATVANGTTSIAVTHGLGYTPNAADIRITPTLLSNSTKWWITSVGATTFTITVDADPGASTATFAWRIGL